MHTTDQRLRFIELRGRGWSLTRIAAELHIAKRTLVDWNRAAQQEIADLQGMEREALHERLLISHEEEVARLTAHLNRLETVLARRKLDCLSTESLFVLAGMVRSQLRRLSAAPVLASLSGEASPVAPSAPAPAEAQP